MTTDVVSAYAGQRRRSPPRARHRIVTDGRPARRLPAGIRARRSLAASEARFRATFEQAAVGIAHVALDGRWLRVNDRLCRITGYDREALLARTFQQITHPEDLDADLALVQRLLAGEITTYALEKRYIRADGSPTWVNLTVSLPRGDDGRPLYFIAVVEQIDDRKRAEAALQASEERLRLALEAARLSVWEWDFTNDIRRSHGVIDRAYPALPSSFADFLHIVHPDDRARVWEAANRAAGEGIPYDPEYRVLLPDGSVAWVATRGQLVRRGDGPPLLAGVAMDITERKRVEQALVRSERLFRSLAVATAQIIRTLDRDGNNDSALRLQGIDDQLWVRFTGQTDAEAAELGWREVIHPDDRARAVREFEAGSARGEPFAVEYRVRRFDGAWRVVIDRAVPVLDDQGEIECWIGAVTDVTDIREAETEIERGNSRLRRIFDANVVGACIWRDGLIVDANDAFLAMLGVSRADVQAGKLDWRAITPPRWREADEAASREMRETGTTAPFEKSYLRADGSEVPVLLVAARFADSVNEGVSLVIDLSERKERERFEQEFLAGVAHDLKNPLAAMKAQAQLMQRRLTNGRLTAELARDGLMTIEHNVVRVANRLEELMDVALLRAGHALILKREPVDLVALAKRQVASYRQATDRHTLVIAPPAEPLVGRWDAARVERILDNLLSNAIKYSPHGGEVRVELAEEADARGSWAVIAVSDEGVGIPAGDLPHIFHRMRRATNVLHRMQGTGIGLAGVHQLVELHGGTMTAESEEGRGSRFTVRLPLDEC